MSAVPARKKLPAGKGAKGAARKVVLEKVIGNTIVHNSAFACNPATGDLAYPAGSVVVIYSPKKNRQIKFLTNRENKAISFLKFSPNGKFLAVGESGHKPAVYVWDTSTWAIVSELRGHKFGVSCGSFSPNNKYLVTVGFQHDGNLFVWDWRNGTAAASNKVTTKVYAVAFSEDGSYFVTAGFRHVKFWYVDSIGATKPNEKPKIPGQTSVIEGRAGTLGANRDSVFLDVACGTGPAAAFTFCVTSKGLVCQFGPNRSMDRWVNLKVDRVFGLAVTQDIIACACSDGIVRLFQALDLAYLTTIPKPHAIGKEDSGPGDTPGDTYPDALAVQLSSDSQRLSVVYTDRSLLLWDLRNPKKAGFLRAFLAHCGCIWDVVVPNAGPLPEGSFITCSADNTIRVWNLDLQNLAASVSASVNVEASIASLQKMYNKDTVRTIHAGNDYSTFKAKDNVDVRTSSEMLPAVSHDTGIRCLAVAPDGKQLAAGDRQGNLRIYNLPSYQCAAEQEVHDAEILSLDYSNQPSNPPLLATASRDRLVHVFDASKNYDLVSTLDDHSSSITAVKFAMGGTRLLTCSADKSIVFRNVEQNPGHSPSIKRYHQTVVQYGTLYDMDVDPTQKYLVSAGQDKKLSIYTLNQPKVIRSYKTDVEAGEVLKVSLDPAGIYAVTSCADKVMRIYDFYSGECLAKMTGHSELVTGVKFTRDCRRIISVAGDGCIFVWKLSAEFTKSMKDRMAERVTPSPSRPLSTPSSHLPLGAATPVHGHSNAPNVSPITSGKHYANDPDLSNYDFHPVPHGEVFGKDHDASVNESVNPKFKFSETALPAWAKGDKSAAPPKEERPPSAAAADKPKGRWGQRAEGNEGFALYSDLGEEDKPVVRWAEKGRRYTIEPDSIHSEKGDKWASPTARNEPRAATNAKDLLVSDMESSARLANSKPADDEDIVMEDHTDFADSDPRMRASQVGVLEDDDDESGETGGDEEEEEKDENQAKGEEEKEEPIYFQGEDNSKGFEVDTTAKAIHGSDNKTPAKQEEEEEEIEDLKDVSEIKEDEEEVFRKMYEKFDFIKSNFDNLSVAPLAAQNPMRLSISRKFLEQPGKPGEEKANTSTEESRKAKKTKEPLSKEVEKTRERLARMGIVLPSATLKSSSDGQSSLTTSSSSTSTSVTSPTAVSPPSHPRLASSSSSSKITHPSSTPPSSSPPQARATSPSSVPPTLSPTQTLSSTTVRTSPTSTAQFAATNDTLRDAGTTLRRPPAEYESALGALSATLNQSLQMWKELRESAQSDPTASGLNRQFQSLFASFSEQVAKVDPTVTAAFTPATTQAPMEASLPADARQFMERYSDLLVEKVVQKLDSVDLQTRLLQSLSASMKHS